MSLPELADLKERAPRLSLADMHYVRAYYTLRSHTASGFGGAEPIQLSDIVCLQARVLSGFNMDISLAIFHIGIDNILFACDGEFLKYVSEKQKEDEAARKLKSGSGS